jgi:hypothetical protein
MPDPFNPWSWLDTLFQWFINSWSQSGGQALQDAVKQLTEAQFPDLSEAWFLTLWNSTFGLSLVIGLGAIMVHAIVFVFNERYNNVVAAFAGFIRLVLNGGFLLVLVVIGMALADFLIRLMVEFTSNVIDLTTWTQQFTLVADISGMNIWLRLAISQVGMTIGNLLYLNTLMLNFWIYVFVVWYLLGSALGIGKVAQFVRSMISASLITVLFARVVQVFQLGVAAAILSAAQAAGVPQINILLGVVAAGFLALNIPAFMMVAFTIASYKVERRLDVRAFLEKQRNTAPADLRQLAGERAGKIRAIGDGVKDAAGSTIRWAALAATTAAFTKAGTALAAKAAMAVPTPHSKAIGLGLFAAQAGVSWLENRTRSYIDTRVGRPGASRARARTGSSY